MDYLHNILRYPLGNHHILLPGNYKLMMNDFFQTIIIPRACSERQEMHGE